MPIFKKIILSYKNIHFEDDNDEQYLQAYNSFNNIKIN